METEPGPEVSPNSSNPNFHFFRPNDGIYVSEGTEHRTICVSPHLPPPMARSGEWRVEDFELHKELYRGKTSLLYMATDRISGMQVALKLYRKRKLSILNRYQVEREVRLHINLHHDNIIHLYAAFEDEKHVYMVQEFALCGDLFEDLKKGGGQMKEKYAARDVIVPFLSALSYLHAQGIIHRDIKPENILLGANKVVKVADFGLSINVNHERPVTRAGTLDYMAPEVLVCPDKRRPEENKDKVLLGYTAQVDSWAVGILAYELLVGYPPFEQESRAATYEHIMYKEPKFPAWMSEEARKFICLALCKPASQRPTIADLMAHPWVTPYMQRTTISGAPGGSTHGPSRLRNSVSMVSEEKRSYNGGAGTAAAAAAAATMTGGGGGGPDAHHLHQRAMSNASSMSVSAMSASASGMSPMPPASTAPGGHPGAGAGGSPGGSITSQAPQPARLSVTVPGGSMLDSNGSPKYAQRSPQPPTHGSPTSLHTSSSFRMPQQQQQQGLDPYEPATRLHDSISDPSARAGPTTSSASSSALYQHDAHGPSTTSQSHAHHGMDLARPAPPAVRQGAALQSGPSGNFASRLGMPASGRTPPPLHLEGVVNSAAEEGYGEVAPMSPSGGGRVAALARSNTLTQSASQRHRMAAPPLSPKPTTPDLVAGYHRPASGVLSDDSFLPPARSPSMSIGGQGMLSPLQAAVLGPRPGSRLNSPSHSRRNSLSTAGNDTSQSGAAVSRSGAQVQYQHPLPQLSTADGSYGDTSYMYDDRGSAAAAAAAAIAAGGKYGKQIFTKLWGRDGGNGGSGTDTPIDSGPNSSAQSFSSRGGGAGANASPMARSAAVARARLLTPDDSSMGGGVRPLMRESSLSSTPKTSGGGGGLREELAQGSMTMYHRPGKVPGVGRAAQAAREAAEQLDPLAAPAGVLKSTKSLVAARALNGSLHDEASGMHLARMGSDVALARTAAGAAATQVTTQRSFTGTNSAFGRKLANGAIATKVTEYVKGRMPHDEDMND